MTEIGARRWSVLRFLSVMLMNFVVASMFASAERSVMIEDVATVAGYENGDGSETVNFVKLVKNLFQTDGSGYHHIWPEMEFGWKIVLGSFIGFCGAAFGSVGGVGGGGIFVPMLTLIIGFDAKSATAMSKCMIMGAAASTVYYNLKLRHPTLDMPIIDYDLALLIQPMLMLGISIGVAFNVIFADWMVTVLLIVLFIGTSTKAFFRGVETWKKETIMKKLFNFRRLLSAWRTMVGLFNSAEAEYKVLPGGPSNGSTTRPERTLRTEVPILENVCWKELGLLVFVWIAFLGLQIGKNYTSTCSTWYWVLNLSQIPISFGVSGYEAVSLHKGTRIISSMGDSASNLSIGQLVLYCSCGVLAGLVGGLLGLGGGFIMGPLFLELGVPPQVSSATATFAMTFSSSMSVVEYYLLKRFPVPYAAYFLLVATIAAFVGQHVVRRLIIILGRASLIIFILAFTIFVSAISLGGVGIVDMIGKFERHEYMGFENLCKYEMSGSNRQGNRSASDKSGSRIKHTDWKPKAKIDESVDGSCSKSDKSLVTGYNQGNHSASEKFDGRIKHTDRKPKEKIDGSLDSSCAKSDKSSDTGECIFIHPASDPKTSKLEPISLGDDEDSSKKTKQIGDKSQKEGDNERISHHVFDICPKKVGSAVKLKTPIHVKNRERRNQMKQATSGDSMKILRSGMVLMKGCISPDDQVSIVKTCRELGIGDGGFYQPGYRSGTKLHLKMMCLGKNWDPDTHTYTDIRPFDNSKPPGIPEKFLEMVKKAIKDSNEFILGNASSSDERKAFPPMSPDLCIINFYSKSGKLGLHQDKDESETSLRKGLPVVSFSIGDSAEFLYGETRSVDEADTVTLESGDVLIFGGKSRSIFHGVTSVTPNTAPTSVMEATDMLPGRLNLTFRQY
ncbi:hypothetical protein SSX86_023703 [Deinandra increscens subsp. villosa]|uniref:Fe2OG dioxygenase domain-containing protein n=1 Tax=Deinandra increscens subsp. villosa TaxID=3103831 RepID=A0AAP0GSL1_9ASTR